MAEEEVGDRAGGSRWQSGELGVESGDGGRCWGFGLPGPAAKFVSGFIDCGSSGGGNFSGLFCGCVDGLRVARSNVALRDLYLGEHVQRFDF